MVSYLDNPQCSQEAKDEAEYLKRVDYDAYAHIWLGQVRQHTEAQVFKNKYKVESFEIDEESILETIYAAQISLAEMSADIAQEGSCSTVNSLETLLNYTHDYRLATTSQSVVIRPQYPHVIEACAEPVTVPVEQLLPFAPSDSLLYRL
jgi:hypothetical protein